MLTQGIPVCGFNIIKHIVASLRDWQSLLHTAGCDVYTVPCKVLQEFFGQDEVTGRKIRGRLGYVVLGLPVNCRQHCGEVGS